MRAILIQYGVVIGIILNRTSRDKAKHFLAKLAKDAKKILNLCLLFGFKPKKI
jgi:hypothetical protein